MMRAPLWAALCVALASPATALAAQPHAVETLEHEAAEPGHGETHAGAHGAQGDAHGGHGEAHGGHEAHINWAHGFVGEKDGVEPDLLWRPVGTPPPVLASIINAGLLFFILFKFGKAPLAEGLKKRKARIVAGMNDAAKMREEAQESLGKYEEKLRHVDEEIERVRREMRESAEAERTRILGEAKERRARMERDARILIEQEMKAAREALMHETVRSAVKSATEMLEKHVTLQDHERLATEYVDMLSKTGVNAAGGRA